MQVKVETSGKGFEVAKSPVVELKPEAPDVDRTSPITSSHRFTVQQKEAIPALSAHVDAVTDVVDLHNPSNKDNLSQVTYSMAGALRGDPLRERYVAEMPLKSEDEYVRKQRQTPHEQTGDEPLLINEERLIHYNLTARRFIATQEMTEHQSRTEKKLAIEIEV